MNERPQNQETRTIKIKTTNFISRRIVKPIGKGVLLVLADAVYLDHVQHKQVTDEIQRTL